jgi:hypothetical protein
MHSPAIQTITGGKYEVAMSIEKPEIAQEYLAACIEESVQAGIDRKCAERIERQNIIDYARRFNKAIQYRVKVLFGD